ncbi:MAG: UDP-N-acetylmuramate:L-alanyl-gamma-D-glutamyl-meso-diaminopimelate ligase [Gammaproteobacteria bacterium]|nr:UDP-N-acetylmuramate:L-alanyl-gamma-D-glutamyl-meso-diaminopimelate ligase [Gammaproteobacteria bacterium]
MHIHFIGICGTFMAGLARIATELGHNVTGSDRDFYPPMSDQLIEMGVKTYKGFDEAVWDTISPDLVIVGNVCSRGMPIIESMLERQLEYTSGPHWLGEQVLKNKYVFAIAGTHGKTTTTSMLTHILRENNIDAGYLIGGIVPSLGYSANVGVGDYFVIEADEYDCAYFDKRPKFIHYQPNTFVVGNAEFDHADIYEHVGQIENQFHYGVRLVPPNGTVIFGKGEHVVNIRNKGVWSQSIDMNNDDYSLQGSTIFQNDLDVGVLPSHFIGNHNQVNAMIACVASQQAGISISDACKALESFDGVKRRLELIGEVSGIRVYDDFAHHPTAIDCTLSAMRENFPEKRIISVFEPRSNTMKKGAHSEILGKVLNKSDVSYIYLSDTIGWSIKGQHVIESNIDLLCTRLVGELRSGDEIVIMSNGSFSGLHTKLISGLESKYG